MNVPLALACVWLVIWFYRPAFAASLVIGYWLTNVAGFVLLQKGAQQTLSEKKGRYSRRDLLRDVGIFLLYTALIVLLVKLRVLKPIQEYLRGQ